MDLEKARLCNFVVYLDIIVDIEATMLAPPNAVAGFTKSFGRVRQCSAAA